MRHLVNPVILCACVALAGCPGPGSRGDTTPGPHDAEPSCPCSPSDFGEAAEAWFASAERAEELEVAWIPEGGEISNEPGAARAIEGSLAQPGVVDAIGEHIDPVVECLVEEARGRTATGRVVINFTVQADGGICGASLGGPTALRPAAASCVLDAVCEWRFPETTEPLLVAYPIFLESE